MCRLFGEPGRGVSKDPGRDVCGVGPGKEAALSDGGADTLISETGVPCMLHAMVHRRCHINLIVLSANDFIRKRRRFQAACHIGKFRLWASQTQESMSGKFENDGEPIIAERCVRSTCGSTGRLNGERTACSATLRNESNHCG